MVKGVNRPDPERRVAIVRNGLKFTTRGSFRDKGLLQRMQTRDEKSVLWCNLAYLLWCGSALFCSKVCGIMPHYVAGVVYKEVPLTLWFACRSQRKRQRYARRWHVISRSLPCRHDQISAWAHCHSVGSGPTTVHPGTTQPRPAPTDRRLDANIRPSTVLSVLHTNLFIFCLFFARELGLLPNNSGSNPGSL